MLTKYILHIGSTNYELQADDLANWDEIRCSYKRANYDGVVRSFTSQFVFVNHAKELLMALYLKDRYSAKASISVHSIDDRWNYEKKFECPLDFSTISWESYTLKINSVDNSLAALIKANKSTKYEFAVGSDIARDAVFNFDRMPMQESLTYEFTQGAQFDNCADLLVTILKGENPYIGNVGNETTINLAIDWNDDQTSEANSYLFKAKIDIELTLDFEISWRSDYGSAGTNIGVQVRRNGSDVAGAVTGATMANFMALPGPDGWTFVGNFSNPGSLNSSYPNPSHGQWALISDIVWYVAYNGRYFYWANSGKSRADYFTHRNYGRRFISLKAGDEVYIYSYFPSANQQRADFRIVSSKFLFSWLSKGPSVDIPAMTPEKVATTLLRRIAQGKINVNTHISQFDSRINNTFLFAAESARGISGAKFYSSFNEFCDWMATVFGYVYYIGSPMPPRFLYQRYCKEYEYSPWDYQNETYVGPMDSASGNVVYIVQHARFLFHDTKNEKLFLYWSGWENYNDPKTGHPRTDTLFVIEELSATNAYYFDEYKGETALYPILYDYSDDDIGKDGQTVYFVHRSELLKDNAPIRSFPNCKGLKYTVDTSVIYSTITIGYDKKDYDNINGRDEFNFNNSYSTGCDVSDKTLSLLSKYRADCYGIEFAVQKRGEETTDSTSDKDVFFVLCKMENGNLIPDRSIEIQNSLTGSVFNGAFSPISCVRANAGYIGLQADSIALKFASSTGNSSIIIGGEAMTSDIELNTPLATCGIIEFTTDEVDDIANVNELIEVVNEGVLYRGFLKEVDIKYAKTEAAKYKLIVKDIEP